VNKFDLLKFCNVPSRIRNVLSRFEVSILEPVGASLYYYGDTGVGKSVIATAVLARELFRSVNVAHQLALLDPTSDEYDPYYTPPFTTSFLFVNLPDLLFRIKEGFSRSKAREIDNPVRRCIEARVIVLDDFGTELTTDWAYQTLYLIVNSRYDNTNQTIFTSNFSPAELGAKLSDGRLVSRIIEMCRPNGVVHLTGEGYRV